MSGRVASGARPWKSMQRVHAPRRAGRRASSRSRRCRTSAGRPRSAPARRRSPHRPRCRPRRRMSSPASTASGWGALTMACMSGYSCRPEERGRAGTCRLVRPAGDGRGAAGRAADRPAHRASSWRSAAAHSGTAALASSMSLPIVMKPWIWRSKQMCVARLPASLRRCA